VDKNWRKKKKEKYNTIAENASEITNYVFCTLSLQNEHFVWVEFFQ